jgi:hypothetical protein
MWPTFFDKILNSKQLVRLILLPFFINWIIMKKCMGISCSTILQLAHSMNVLPEVSDEQAESLRLWHTCFPNVKHCDPKKMFMWITLIYTITVRKYGWKTSVIAVWQFCYVSITTVQDVRSEEKQVGIMRPFIKVKHFILCSSNSLFL